MERHRAISIRQPFAEQIMLGEKKVEYRSRPTLIRERVYVYAGQRRPPAAVWEDICADYGNLPLGVIIGTVELYDCKRTTSGRYEWLLRKPRRLRRPVKPKEHPQPAWFYPFGR